MFFGRNYISQLYAFFEHVALKEHREQQESYFRNDNFPQIVRISGSDQPTFGKKKHVVKQSFRYFRQMGCRESPPEKKQKY